jgi:hypothetical protein
LFAGAHKPDIAGGNLDAYFVVGALCAALAGSEERVPLGHTEPEDRDDGQTDELQFHVSHPK